MSADTVKTTLYLKFNNKAGYILIVYSSLISFALILFAGAYLSFQENQVRQLQREISSIKAFYIAQAGLKKISYLNNTALNENFGAGSYDVTSSYDEYTSVGEVRGVKRTLKADIEKTGTGPSLGDKFKPYIEGTIYAHDTFSLPAPNLRGLVDGKGSLYALQTGATIESFMLIRRIIFKGPVIDETKRPDYRNIWKRLFTEKNKICFITNTDNDNNNIIEHNSSNSRRNLNVGGGGEYYFAISPEGRINVARLTVLKNKSYTLPAGNYFLQSIVLKEEAKLRVSGPVTIFLYSTQSTDELRLEQNATINKNGNSGDFTLLGFNKYPQNTNKPMIEMFKGSQLYGAILAPYYQFWIREGAILKGALLVHDFNMWQKSDPNPSQWQIIYADLSQSGSSSFSIISNWKEL